MSLKILGILPHSIGGRLTISSIFDGFTLNGHDVTVIDLLKIPNSPKLLELLKISDTHKSSGSITKLEIQTEQFDFIAGYGFSAIKFNEENKLKLKTINYFSDVIETSAAGNGYDVYRKCLYEDGNYSFYWDKDLVEKSDYKNLFYMPHFVNTNIYKDLNLKKEYDVMFAGRLDTDYRLNSFVKLLKSLPEVKFAWFAIEKHFNDALSRVSDEDKFLIKNSYVGFIDNEKDMAEALNKSKIVINFNSQGLSSLNYRTFQTLACQTLLISDERKELDLFDNIIPTYNSLEDLPQKIKYWLSNDHSQITETCRKIIEKKHSSKLCTQYMLSLIK
ncbi:glycosyltransferase [bacterium]|nr:glycosyltransferase [bacterium]